MLADVLQGDFLQLAHYTQDGRRKHAKMRPREAKKHHLFSISYDGCSGAVAGLSDGRRRGPPRRGEIGPDPAERGEGLGIGAGHPCLAAQRDDFLEQRGAPQRGRDGPRSRRAAGSAQPRRGAGATRSAWARTRPISSAFCSPVEHTLAGISLGPCADDRGRSGAGPRSVRPAARSRSRPARERRDVVVLDVDGRPCAARSASSVPTRASSAQGKSAAGARVAPRADRGRELGDGRGARGGDRNAGLGHDALEALEARRLAHVVSQQAVALLHGALELPEQRCGSSGRGTAISRSRKRRRSDAGPGEQAVHGRRQPDHLDVLGERAGACLRLAVDAHDAAAARPASAAG